ncbi:hypothetical protein ACTXT7_014999 [Hymenolepis weldensis]
MSLPELQRKWPQRRLLPRIFYKQFNGSEPEQQESVNSDKKYIDGTPPVSNASGGAVRLYGWMRCEAPFEEKTISEVCYVTDQNSSLVGLDWIDELNLMEFPDKNETCQTPILEPTSGENLVRGCNQYLYVAEIPHPTIPTQLSKPDSPSTQLQLTVSGPTKSATHLMVIDSHSKGSNVIPLSPTTSRSPTHGIPEVFVMDPSHGRCTAAIAPSGNTYDVDTGKNTICLTPEQPMISRCSATVRKKRSRCFPQCTTRTRWHSLPLPIDLATKADG